MALSAPITASASGDNTVVAAVTGKKVSVKGYELSASAAVNAKWRDGTTDKTGLLYLAAAGSRSHAIAADNEDSLFETTAGNALVLNLSAAVPVGGFVSYTLE